MDSDCLRHMNRDKQQLLSLTSFEWRKMSFGDGKKGTIIGVGKIDRSESKTLEEIYHTDG